MNEPQNEPREEILDAGMQLLDRDEEDAYSFLGIQAERLEIAEARLHTSRAVPVWSDDEALAKVLSDQRAPLDQLKHYAAKGKEFVQNLLTRLGAEFREVLCLNQEVRPEVLACGDDAKTILKYVATALVGIVAASLPAAIALAAASIATALAVILIRNNLQQFCATGAAVVR